MVLGSARRHRWNQSDPSLDPHQRKIRDATFLNHSLDSLELQAAMNLGRAHPMELRSELSEEPDPRAALLALEDPFLLASLEWDFYHQNSYHFLISSLFAACVWVGVLLICKSI